VYLETLVNGIDHIELRGRKLQSTSLVTGVRLWLPLDHAGAAVFSKAVAAALSIEELTKIAESSGGKRFRKGQTRARGSEEVYMKPVDGVSALMRLSRLYFVGKPHINGIQLEPEASDASGSALAIDPSHEASNGLFDDEAEEAGDDLDAGGDVNPAAPASKRKTFIELFDASVQFSTGCFAQRNKENGTYDVQTKYESYVRIRERDNTLVFYPSNRIRGSGLLREIQCGAESPMLRTASDLLR
jgi:hypothetical protein